MKNKLEIILETLVHFFDEKQTEDIKAFHVSEKLWITDYIVVVTVKNSIHSKSIVTEVVKKFKTFDIGSSNDFYPEIKLSGNSDSGWVILDMNSIIVHCVNAETRATYQIDELFEKQGIIYHY